MRLVPVALTAWLTAAIAIQLPGSAGPVAAGCGVTGIAALVIASRRARWRTVLSLAAVSLAVAGAAAAHVAIAEPARAAVVSLDHSGGRVLEMRMLVVGKVERSGDGWRFDAQAHRIAYGQHVHTGVVPVEVHVDDAPHGLDLGATVQTRGTAFPADAGERAVLVVRTVESPVVVAGPTGAFAVASALRDGLQQAMDGLPQPAAGLVSGLAVGDTSAVTAELDADMKTSSLSHLTAVSGANCALVVGIAFALAGLVGAPRGIRVAAGLMTLAAFVLLVSPEPSVVRAATMAAVAMLGVLLGRVGAGVSVLSLAVAVLLVVDPWLAASLGFALSAAATGALLLAAGPLADGLTRWMPGPVALALSVPLAAQLACGPLLVLIDARVPLYGVVANILAAPAAPAGTVVGLLACLLAGVPVVGAGLTALAWVPAAWVAATATTMAQLPASSVPWPEGWVGLLLLGLLGAVVLALIAPAPARVRHAAVLVLAALGGLGLGAGPIAGVVDRAATPGGWAIVACDVGQGDAVLVRSAAAVALIDAGPDPGPLSRCLDRFGIDRIDLLVLTHFDADHRGGSDAVAGRVDRVLHGPSSGAADDRLLAQLADAGASLMPAQAGQSGNLGDAHWRVLWPRPRDRVYPSGNDASVVISVAGGGVPATIFLGDLSAASQRALLATGRVPAAAIVKVAHHGSADQDDALYRSIGPRLALVTVGENDYGHPRQEILSTLTSLGATIVRTDVAGDVAAWVVGERLQVWRSRAEAGSPDAQMSPTLSRLGP
nr:MULTISPECIES: ComEC/Rec2 family competence protein [Microbacterium]